MKLLLLLLSTLSLNFHAFAQDSTDVNSDEDVRRIHEIKTLVKQADSEKYGLTGEYPVKVGQGKKGGPANQRAYLDLLRDAQGNPLKYKRVGSCCPYPSKNAFFGETALVDKYEIEYKDKRGKKKKGSIFISFYDYEEPMIPAGFQTVAEQ